jgi:hypothetical protein
MRFVLVIRASAHKSLPVSAMAILVPGFTAVAMLTCYLAETAPQE